MADVAQVRQRELVELIVTMGRGARTRACVSVCMCVCVRALTRARAHTCGWVPIPRVCDDACVAVREVLLELALVVPFLVRIPDKLTNSQIHK